MGTGVRTMSIGVLGAAYGSIRSGSWAPEDVDEEVAAE